MTPRAVVRRWPDAHVMARKARRVAGRGVFEETGLRSKRISGTSNGRTRHARGRFRENLCRLMADRAVVKFWRIVERLNKTRLHKVMPDRHAITSRRLGDHILMNIVRKNGRELVRTRTNGKRKTRSTGRGDAAVTGRAEILRYLLTSAVTARTCRVAGELGNIGKPTNRHRVPRRHQMTRIAVLLLMSR